MEKINLFLAGSPIEIIAALACIAEMQVPNPVFLIEQDVTGNPGAIEQLIENSKIRFPELVFHCFSLDRSSLAPACTSQWRAGRRMQWIRQMRDRIDAPVRQCFGLPLDRLDEIVDCVHFNVLHDYVRVILEACRGSQRAFYPHGLDHPRMQQLRETPFLFQPRGILTAIRSLSHMNATAGAGELCISFMYRLLGKHATCLPYDGTDRVYTFRSTPLETAIPLIRLHRLKEILQWLTTLSPWCEELAHLRSSIPRKSLVLLLSEYNQHPIWELNRNWAEAHLSLVLASLKKTRSKTVVIKGHPRSDGTATSFMQDYLKQRLPDHDIKIMPPALSALPIEALALDLEIAAACSLGSCSLPGDIGIDVPHLTSPSIAATFDSGWVGEPFWAKYAKVTQMLIAEGICQDLDEPISP